MDELTRLRIIEGLQARPELGWGGIGWDDERMSLGCSPDDGCVGGGIMMQIQWCSMEEVLMMMVSGMFSLNSFFSCPWSLGLNYKLIKGQGVGTWRGMSLANERKKNRKKRVRKGKIRLVLGACQSFIQDAWWILFSLSLAQDPELDWCDLSDR